jgi:DNA-binding LacI/PurR family transcriptional regulator
MRSAINLSVIMQFVTAVVTAARVHNQDVLLLTKDEGTAGLERVAGATMVDALIVMDVEHDDVRIPVLRRLKQPSVLIGVPDDPHDISCVDLDFPAAGYDCLRHLAGHGHRRMALVGPAPSVYERGTAYADRFMTGFTAAATEFELSTTAHPCAPGMEGVRACLGLIEADVPGATALVVHNEDALPPLLEHLKSTGRRVPQDVSIVALCPRDVALGLPVRLTSVDIPTHDVGTLAVRMAMDMLDGRPGPSIRLLPPTLVERDSCAPPIA